MEAVHAFYENLVATPNIVIQLLKDEPADDAERECLGFLKRYICGLDDDQLKEFPKFTTCSDFLTIDEIKVNFHHLAR